MSSQPGSQIGNNLKPIILPEILQAQKEEVCKVFLDECVKPLEYVHKYDKYLALVSGQAEKDMERFLSEQHSFQDILAQVTYYQQLADQIQYRPCQGGHVSYQTLIGDISVVPESVFNTFHPYNILVKTLQQFNKLKIPIYIMLLKFLK